MSDDTIIMPAVPLKPPGLPLVPILGAAALVSALGALVLFLQFGARGQALAAANAQTAQLSVELGRVREQNAELENQLAARQLELDSVMMSKLPIDVIFRVSGSGTGFVAHFQNRASSTLKLTVSPRRPSSGEYARIELTLPPQSAGDVAEKQGWAFRSGDTLSVSSGDFRPMTLQVP